MLRSKTLTVLVCAILLGMLLSDLGLAQESAFKWGFRERLRNTYMNNNMDFSANRDDEQNFFRVRTNLWGQYTFNSHLLARIQFTNEFRKYLIIPEAKKGEFTLDELIIDNLYFQWKSGSDNPVVLTVGRQNLIYGEGFILLEGGPWDGSRAIYHDAVKLSIKRGATTIDLLGISNTRVEERLPVLSNTDQLKNEKTEGLPKYEGKQWMNDGDESALGVYAVHKSKTGTRWDGYFILKTEQPEPFIGAASNPEKLVLNTVGGRLAKPLGDRFSLVTEWAFQFGKQGDYKQTSYGGYGYLNLLLNPRTKGTLTGGLNILSGDDPDTPDNEGWNPLFARWPKWSELYIYSHIAEVIQGARKVAYWTNTISPYVKYACNLGPKVNFSAIFYHLKAFYGRSLGNEMSGTTRGNELQLLFKFRLTKQISAHFLYDRFFPGDFYPGPRANASFIRGELMFTL